MQASIVPRLNVEISEKTRTEDDTLRRRLEHLSNEDMKEFDRVLKGN